MDSDPCPDPQKICLHLDITCDSFALDDQAVALVLGEDGLDAKQPIPNVCDYRGNADFLSTERERKRYLVWNVLFNAQGKLSQHEIQ